MCGNDIEKNENGIFTFYGSAENGSPHGAEPDNVIKCESDVKSKVRFSQIVPIFFLVK